MKISCGTMYILCVICILPYIARGTDIFMKKVLSIQRLIRISGKAESASRMVEVKGLKYV